MTGKSLLLSVILTSIISSRVMAGEAGERAWDMLKAEPEVVEAWKDMRFGMFVCWGPVSLTGLEIGWSRGKAWPHQKQGGGGPTPVEVYVEFDVSAKEIPLVRLDHKSGSLAVGKKAMASNYFQNSPQFSPDKAFDDDPDTRWGCDWGTHSSWLEVDLGEPKTFNRAFLSEPYDRVQEFELQVWQAGDWKAFHRGTTIGEDRTLQFTPITGQRVRLNLLKTTEGPSLWEFQLFGADKP